MLSVLTQIPAKLSSSFCAPDLTMLPSPGLRPRTPITGRSVPRASKREASLHGYFADGSALPRRQPHSSRHVVCCAPWVVTRSARNAQGGERSAVDIALRREEDVIAADVLMTASCIARMPEMPSEFAVGDLEEGRALAVVLADEYDERRRGLGCKPCVAPPPA